MKNGLLKRSLTVASAILLAASCALAQEHKWAGRTLDDLEWRIHEELAGLPSYGVFDTIDFEVQGKTVRLSGQVVGERVKHSAGRTIRRINGVEGVVNQIEVLPSSRQDDALRMNVYRAIIENKDSTDTQYSRQVHIIVKNGWVTLEGVVNSDAGRDMLHLRTLQITPHVSDHLRVVAEQ
jgi:hyperosmotically inducible protein